MFKVISLFTIVMLVLVSSIFGQSAIVDQGTRGISFNIGYSHYFASVTQSYDNMEHTFEGDDGAGSLNMAYCYKGRADLGISFTYENEYLYNIYTWGAFTEIIPLKEGMNGIPFSLGISGSIAHSSTDLIFGSGGTAYSIGSSLYKFVDLTDKIRVVPGIGFSISKPENIDASHYVSIGVGSSFKLADKYILTVNPIYAWQTDNLPESEHILDWSYHVISINIGLLHTM